MNKILTIQPKKIRNKSKKLPKKLPKKPSKKPSKKPLKKSRLNKNKRHYGGGWFSTIKSRIGYGTQDKNNKTKLENIIIQIGLLSTGELSLDSSSNSASNSASNSSSNKPTETNSGSVYKHQEEEKKLITIGEKIREISTATVKQIKPGNQTADYKSFSDENKLKHLVKRLYIIKHLSKEYSNIYNQIHITEKKGLDKYLDELFFSAKHVNKIELDKIIIEGVKPEFRSQLALLTERDLKQIYETIHIPYTSVDTNETLINKIKVLFNGYLNSNIQNEILVHIHERIRGNSEQTEKGKLFVTEFETKIKNNTDTIVNLNNNSIVDIEKLNTLKNIITTYKKLIDSYKKFVKKINGKSVSDVVISDLDASKMIYQDAKRAPDYEYLKSMTKVHVLSCKINDIYIKLLELEVW